MQRERLRQLANFLKELPENRLNMADWKDPYFDKDDCRTAACALGWCHVIWPNSGFGWFGFLPIYHKGLKFYQAYEAAEEFFGLNKKEVFEIFSPISYVSDYASNIKPSSVIYKINKVLDSGDSD